MRCDQARQLLLPLAGSARPAELEAHLAACPRCARAAAGFDHLSRIWEQTRSDDATDAELDQVWSRVAAALDRGDQAGGVDPARTRAAHGRRVRLGWAVGLATAAGLLGLGVGVSLLRPPVAPTPPAATTLDVVHGLPEIEVELDQTVLIRLGQGVPRQITLIQPSTNPEAYPSLADSTPHEVMNAMESLAQ